MSVFTKLYGLQKQIRRAFQEVEVGTYASGAAFFLFLSLIPMVLIVSGILPHDVMNQKEVVNISQAVVPEKIYQFLLGIVDSYHGNNLTLLSVSAVVVVWSASKGVLALIRGLNHIYEVGETRGYLLLRLKASFYTIFLLLAILLSAGALIFGNTLAADSRQWSGCTSVARFWRNQTYICGGYDICRFLYNVQSVAQ